MLSRDFVVLSYVDGDFSEMMVKLKYDLLSCHGHLTLTHSPVPPPLQT